MSDCGVALAVGRSNGQVVITVPSAYRLWPDYIGQQVAIRWGEAGLVIADLPGLPVVALTGAQRDRLLGYLDGHPGPPIVLQDHFGRFRLFGQLQREAAANE